MKVAFVALMAHQADIVDVDPGLMAMAAHARQAGVELEVFADYRAIDEAVLRLTDASPDLIAFGLYSIGWQEHSAFIAGIRSRLDVPVLCGGYQPTCAPEETIAADGIDYICVGEGDIAFSGFLEAMLRGDDPGKVQGIWSKRGAEPAGVRQTGIAPLAPDLDALPPWDRALFPSPFMRGYHIQKFGRCIPIATGRGCPHRCAFCSNPTMRALAGNSTPFLRKRNPERVVREAASLVERYDPDSFLIVDEQFVGNPDWLEEFCTRWQQEVGRRFIILSSVASLPHQILARLADAGLYLAGMGVEVADEDRRRQLLGKPIRNADILAAFASCRELGIRSIATMMYRLPHETASSIHDTCDFIERCEPDLLLACVYDPLPATALRRLCERDDLLERVPRSLVERRFAHQHGNRERQLQRVGEDSYLRVRSAISEDEYLAASDRVDRLSHRLEVRFFEREQAPALQLHLSRAAAVPRSRREGVLVLRHEITPCPASALESALGAAIVARITSRPDPITTNPYAHGPALEAMARAPLGVMLDCEPDDACSLGRDALRAGCSVLAPLAACAALLDASAVVVPRVPLLYRAGVLGIWALLQRRHAGRIRTARLRARSSANDALVASVLLLGKVAGERLFVSDAWLEILEEPAAERSALTASLASSDAKIRGALELVRSAPDGAERWQLEIETERERFHWSAGDHHETAALEREGVLRRIPFEARSGDETLARAFLVYAKGERSPFVSAREAAEAAALATKVQEASDAHASRNLLEPDGPDILARLPQPTSGELLDLVAGRPGSLLAAPALDGPGGTLFSMAPPHVEALVTAADLFQILSRWTLTGAPLSEVLASLAPDGEACRERVLSWLRVWASRHHRAGR
jgi:radical SAM superfamily enzyme YgiQ (UPF0313 family)